MVIEHPQYFFKCAGGNSCYFDCIMRLASRVTKSPLTATAIGQAIDRAADSGAIVYNTKDDSSPVNFTVIQPDKLMFMLTGKRYSVTKVSRDYKALPDELEVDFWALSEEDGAKDKGHFCLPDYDPLIDSNTRKNGFIYSKRIFRRLP